MAMSLPGGFSSVAELMAEQRKRDERLRKVFDWIDTDNSGTIEYEEFVTAIKQLDSSIIEDDIKTEWEIIDADHSNAMEFQEFKRLMTAHFDKNDAKLELQKVLSQKSLNVTQTDSPKSDTSNKNNSDPNAPSVTVDNNNNDTNNSDEIYTPRRAHKIAVPLSARSLKEHNKRRKEWEAKLHTIFDIIDNDHSGSIELDEMWDYVKNMDLFTYNELKIEFEYYDTDNTHSIEFDEFRKLMMVQYSKVYDESGSGNGSNMDLNGNSGEMDDNGSEHSNETPRAKLQMVISNGSDKGTPKDTGMKSTPFSFPETDVIDENSEMTVSTDDNGQGAPLLQVRQRQGTVIRHSGDLSMNSIDETKEHEDTEFLNNNNNKNNNNSRVNAGNFSMLTSNELQTFKTEEMIEYISILFENIDSSKLESYKTVFTDNKIDGTKYLQYNRGKWKKMGIKDRNDITVILTNARKLKTKMKKI